VRGTRRRGARLGAPTQISVKLSIPLVGDITGVWAPADVERRAAWELYVELITRISVVELAPDQGTLREALSSLYSLFPITREILRRSGPQIAPRRERGQVSFGLLAVTVLNSALRPLLTRWHPALTAYESGRPAGVNPVDHERGWEHARELRAELNRTRGVLTELARILADVADAAYLADPPAERERERVGRVPGSRRPRRRRPAGPRWNAGGRERILG
jgi:hypothetical protein